MINLNPLRQNPRTRSPVSFRNLNSISEKTFDGFLTSRGETEFDPRDPPQNWEIRTSRTSHPGRRYYFNNQTLQSQWNFPEDSMPYVTASTFQVPNLETSATYQEKSNRIFALAESERRRRAIRLQQEEVENRKRLLALARRKYLVAENVGRLVPSDSFASDASTEEDE
jgi:hypothetical protein